MKRRARNTWRAPSAALPRQALRRESLSVKSPASTRGHLAAPLAGSRRCCALRRRHSADEARMAIDLPSARWLPSASRRTSARGQSPPRARTRLLSLERARGRCRPASSEPATRDAGRSNLFGVVYVPTSPPPASTPRTPRPCSRRWSSQALGQLALRVEHDLASSAREGSSTSAPPPASRAGTSCTAARRPASRESRSRRRGATFGHARSRREPRAATDGCGSRSDAQQLHHLDVALPLGVFTT